MNSSIDSVATLLLVDDEPGVLSSLRRLLRPWGYRILTAESAKGGLENLEREPVDLVISDMRMPEMDGAAFLEQVRLRWPLTTRILLTGYADVASTIGAINRGEIFRYVAKPWDDKGLTLIVGDALEARRLRHEELRRQAQMQSENAELRALNAALEENLGRRTAELDEINRRIDSASR
jgi:response regulator RpfG family c-di-GMP phosphodiesterase